VQSDLAETTKADFHRLTPVVWRHRMSLVAAGLVGHRSGGKRTGQARRWAVISAGVLLVELNPRGGGPIPRRPGPTGPVVDLELQIPGASRGSIAFVAARGSSNRGLPLSQAGPWHLLNATAEQPLQGTS